MNFVGVLREAEKLVGMRDGVMSHVGRDKLSLRARVKAAVLAIHQPDLGPKNRDPQVDGGNLGGKKKKAHQTYGVT